MRHRTAEPEASGGAKVIHVDDLAAHAGQAIGTSAWREVTQEDVTQFAVLTGDEQWIHVDPERAAGGPFGTTVSHGFLTLAWFTGMLWEIVLVEGIETILNYGVNRVRFPAPVPVGSRVRLNLTLNSVEDVTGGVAVAYGASFEIEGQAKPGCVAEVLFRYYPAQRSAIGSGSEPAGTPVVVREDR
jgi:acyl dehydratase